MKTPTRSVLLLASGLVLLSLVIWNIAAVSDVQATHQATPPTYVVPYKVRMFTHGTTYYGGFQVGNTMPLTSLIASLQPANIDINGDGLLDLVFSADVSNADSDMVYTTTNLMPSIWKQYVYLNSGSGYIRHSFCTYANQQEYDQNCF